MTDNLNLDTFVHNDLNRKKFIIFLKTVSTHHSIDNLLTLYLLITCFKNCKTDAAKLKQINDKTYQTCIQRHPSTWRRNIVEIKRLCTHWFIRSKTNRPSFKHD